MKKIFFEKKIFISLIHLIKYFLHENIQKYKNTKTCLSINHIVYTPLFKKSQKVDGVMANNIEWESGDLGLIHNDDVGLRQVNKHM